MPANNVSWQDIVLIISLLVAILALVRDYFGFSGVWKNSASALKRFVAGRAFQFVVLIVILVLLGWSLYTRIQRLETLVAVQAVEIENAKATIQALNAQSTAIPQSAEQPTNTPTNLPSSPTNAPANPTENIPTLVAPTDAPGTGELYRPSFFYEPAGGYYQDKTTPPPIVDPINNAESLISYRFDYDLPLDRDGYAGFVIQTSDPVDVSKYKYLRVVYSLGDPGAKGRVLLRDSSDNLSYISIDSPPPEIHAQVSTNGDINTVLIPVSSFQNVALDRVNQVGIDTHTSFVRGKHTIIIIDIAFTN